MEIHVTLRGSRMKDSRLTIPGLSDDDYESLYEYILEQLPPHIIHDYFDFLHRQALRYFKNRRKRKFRPGVDMDPLCMMEPEELDTRQQLGILKWYVSKLAYKKPFHTLEIEEVH